MIYDVIVKTEPESEYIRLSYEDVLKVMIDSLLSRDTAPMTIRRRCCGSVHEQTMSAETCERIRSIAGITPACGDNADDMKGIRSKLDAAVNNWYLRGVISVSEEKLTVTSEQCPADP
ncbi:MAG: hypothetical protein LBJ20_06755 [Candidatus Methanoplasma sp.]|nr:hypothetical protein [Candidatus Methanoplasma sp.]